MVTIKIIKELSNHYIRGNLSRFDDNLIKKLKKAKVNDIITINERFLPQCAAFAVLEDGTRITPLKALAISTITTTNGEMLVGIYGGARKISNGTFNVTVDDDTDIMYGRLVRVTNTNSIDIINNYFLFTNSTDYPAPGGTNYSVEFFNEDFQFLGKTPLFTIKNDYSDIETGPPIITEDFTGTSDSALQLTLTMSPLYDGFTYDNSFDALNWRVSIITLNGDAQTLNGWINDGIAVISGDNHEILTITYNEIATHWLVGVSFIWCANSRKKINETYSYPPSGGVGPNPPTDISGDITPTDPTEEGGNGSASFDVDTSPCTGAATASLDPANGTTPIDLENGENTGIIFDDLPPDDYTLNVYCDDTLIATGDFTINDFDAPTPTTTITNIVPTDPTEEGGNGSVSFDATVADCTGDSVCRLNPPAGTSDITLTEGSNTGLTFTNLPPDTYTIEAYCDDVSMGSEEFTINDFVAPDPEATITNVVATDATTNGGTDGTITFNVEISNFVDTPTVVLNPANGTTAITLTDGTNTGVSFNTVPAGTYTIEVYDGDTLIASEEGVTVSEPAAPTGSIDNIVPTSPTTEDGTDGSIDFDANSTGCTGTSTAVLNPASGTTAITLTSGDNTDLTFSPLPAGDYTIQIYCDETLVEESDTITIPDFVAPADGEITNIVPTAPTTEDNDDGEISFDADVTGCTGAKTAVLNPAAGTTPITLTDGTNTGISFTALPAGDYTIQIYCDSTLIGESSTVTIPAYVPAEDLEDLIPNQEAATGEFPTNGSANDFDLLFYGVQEGALLGNNIVVGTDIQTDNSVKYNLHSDNYNTDSRLYAHYPTPTSVNIEIVGTKYTGITYLKGKLKTLTKLSATDVNLAGGDDFVPSQSLFDFDYLISKTEYDTWGKGYSLITPNLDYPWEMEYGGWIIYGTPNVDGTNLHLDTTSSDLTFSNMWGFNVENVEDLTGQTFNPNDYTFILIEITFLWPQNPVTTVSQTGVLLGKEIVADGLTEYIINRWYSQRTIIFNADGSYTVWDPESLVSIKGIKTL